jgi:chromosomal replication initiator protein
VSLPVRFLRNWIADHYYDGLLDCCRAEFPTVQRVELVVRSVFRTRL